MCLSCFSLTSHNLDGGKPDATQVCSVDAEIPVLTPLSSRPGFQGECAELSSLRCRLLAMRSSPCAVSSVASFKCASDAGVHATFPLQ